MTDAEAEALVGTGALPMLLRIAGHPTVRDIAGMGYDALTRAPLREVLMLDVLADYHDRVTERAKLEAAADRAHADAVRRARGGR